LIAEEASDVFGKDPKPKTPRKTCGVLMRTATETLLDVGEELATHHLKRHGLNMVHDTIMRLTHDY